MRERVVILGAAGFIGTALRHRLHRSYDLESVDLKPIPSPLPDERCDVADVTDPSTVDRLVVRWAEEGDRLAAIIDLVAHYDFENRADPRYRQVESGLGHLMDRMGSRIPQCVPFLFASSMASLASTEPGRRQTESSPRSGAWAYPAHKLRCEEILESAPIPHPRVELVLAAVYGDWCELVPLYFHLERIRTRSLEAYVYPGRTDRGLTYLHRDECAIAFERAIEATRGQSGVHRYLIGQSEPTTYDRIQRSAAQVFGHGPRRTLRVPKLLARTGASVLNSVTQSFVKPWMVRFAGEHFEFDLSHTEAELKWSPTRHLTQDLEAICRRALEAPQRWRELNQARPR